jgi:uncharacterized RDD family membrane protein YckC
LYCGKCGAEIPDGAGECAACGQRVGEGAIANAGGASVASRGRVVFAGFWLRLVAYLIDSVTVSLLVSPILWDLLTRNLGPNVTLQNIVAFYASGTPQSLALQMLIALSRALYFAVFESSGWQATPGKKMLGLYVTDLSGRRVTLWRAAGRSFGMIISDLTLWVGFLMAAFTQRKQALHDVIAGCLVLRKS